MNRPGASDEQLWRLACDGDREAFGAIVKRYQSLVCSIAFSACGALGSSEDIAQETFLRAWRQLKELREPAKLRQWLCGIVRHLSLTAIRREHRRGGPPETLDAEREISHEENPAAQTVTREEESLLWRTLASLPENYREPLVLFYREENSIAEVARHLDLSEDTVKQRLSRGRAMLRDEMAAMVESTLHRTRPGKAFTLAVLIALPAASSTASAAVIAAGAVAAKSGASATSKGLLAQLGFWPLIGPIIGLTCSYLATKAAASRARSEPERKLIVQYSRQIIAFCLIMSLGLAAVLGQAGKLYTASAAALVLGITAWTLALVGGIIVSSQRLDRKIHLIRIDTGTTDDASSSGGKSSLPKYFESEPRLLGLPLFAMSWGGYDSVQAKSRKVCAWIAVGDIALSPFVAFGGLAIAPIAMGAISIGVLSLSIFWGIAVGLFAAGSLAFGWWAIGCAAAGINGAVGFAAIARDYAIGIVTSAAATGAPAKAWLKTEWPADFAEIILHQGYWWLLLSVLLALALRKWRASRSS